MLEDLVVSGIVLMIACGPIIYGLWVNRKRKNLRAERARLARKVLLKTEMPFVKKKLMSPNKTWIEAQNDLRRRRLSIPRVKSHV